MASKPTGKPRGRPRGERRRWDLALWVSPEERKIIEDLQAARGESLGGMLKNLALQAAAAHAAETKKESG